MFKLRFDGPTLTAYTRPHLMTENKTIFWGDPNYWNVLRALIDVQVENAGVCEGKELRLNFQNGTAIKISLADKDYRGPEALQFENGSGSVWVV